MSYQENFMKQAISLAEESIQKGGGPFGAVIVRNGELVGKGSNGVTIRMDPTAHAEVTAIRDACKNLNTFKLDGCEIYTSCEPCPMCLSAIYWAHIDKIYYGATKDDAAKVGFDDSFIYKELDLPQQERKIKAIQYDQNLAKAVFDNWDKKEDKTEY